MVIETSISCHPLTRKGHAFRKQFLNPSVTAISAVSTITTTDFRNRWPGKNSQNYSLDQLSLSGARDAGSGKTVTSAGV